MLKPELNTEFCRFIAVKAIEAETIVSSHCYVFPSILLSTRNLVQKGGVAKLVYDAHNVEYLMKKEMVLSINSSAQLNSTVTGILQDLQKIEESLINTSQEIWSCSSDDQVYFQDILKKDHAHSPVFKVIPNGESFGDKKKYSLDEKKSLKQELGLAGFSKLTVFIGSLHLPNVIALKNILNIARSCPEIGFLIIGSVCNARDEEELLLKNNASDNVFFMGVLDEPVKAYLMSIADIGLNPVSEGSGTNLKNFDYLKHYLYVVSTPKGVRGLPPIFDVIELDAFANTLNDIAKQNEDILNQKVMKMRFQIARIYDWKQISKQVVATLQN
jgi:glycosyltransferase involved in cell wall biosynthesis